MEYLPPINLTPTDLEEALSVRKLYCIFSHSYAPDFVFRGESHEPWELVYVHGGRVIVETNDYACTLERGMAILHRPWNFHKIRADGVACTVFVITFSTDRNEPVLPVSELPIKTDEVAQSYIMNIVKNGNPIVAGKNLIPPLKKFDMQHYAAGQTVKNFLELLLIHFIRMQTAQQEPERGERKSPVVRAVMEALERHLCEKTSLQIIAAEVGYSPSRLTAIFRKETGSSVINTLIELRIRRAQELILLGTMTLKAISDHLGFDTVQYFSTQFKKVTGLSPSQYKNLVSVCNSCFDLNLNKVK